MKLATTLMAGALIAAFTLPAAAEEFYIVQNAKTRTCTITHQKPTSTEYTMVGPNGTIYKTQVEAESAMKTVKVCHND